MKILPFGRGWTRFGVLSTALWLVVVLTFACIEYILLSRQYAGWEDLQPSWWEVRNTLAACSASKKAPIATCWIDIGRLTLLLFGPVVVGWTVAIAMGWGWKWVSAGFQSDKRAKP
ncbi:hypothetical protein [Ralstonia pseudosolanacearum]|uniref:hypothetical protein n=1 Tax=Ralstonia pseudosolanacearum TaxID=1310165 RepID=UPI003CEF7507